MRDLRERAARACAYAVEMQHSTLDVVKTLGFSTIEAFVDKAWPNYLPQADAAIALALEEAAKVAEDCSVDLNGTYAAIHIAAAIRALKEKSDE